ncbi:PAS domain-containing protein [Undibacterium sp. Xuan67W]|uniref:PAS domain-containing protein n=1 Tax=Undibacterium sp. Xuan67W TaxID=3413057 RepID=UPI003BEFD417
MKHPEKVSADKAVQIFNAVNMGLVLIDANEHILMWNDWMVKHSMIETGVALQKKFQTSSQTNQARLS